jgi:hypothetical protein
LKRSLLRRPYQKLRQAIWHSHPKMAQTPHNDSSIDLDHVDISDAYEAEIYLGRLIIGIGLRFVVMAVSGDLLRQQRAMTSPSSRGEGTDIALPFCKNFLLGELGNADHPNPMLTCRDSQL